MSDAEILNGAASDMFEQHRTRLRALYSQTVSDVMDRCLEEVVLPAEQATILIDAAQFTVFMFAIKTVELLGGKVTERKELMQAYRALHKAIDGEVPKMLMEFVDAANAEAAGQG